MLVFAAVAGTALFVTMTVMPIFVMMAAYSVGIIAKVPSQKCYNCFIGRTCYAWIKLNPCLRQCCPCAASDAPANKDIHAAQL